VSFSESEWVGAGKVFAQRMPPLSLCHSVSYLRSFSPNLQLLHWSLLSLPKVVIVGDGFGGLSPAKEMTNDR